MEQLYTSKSYQSLSVDSTNKNYIEKVYLVYMNTIKDFFTKIFNRPPAPADGIAPVGFAPHEEFESKRTTKLGMVFVIIMVITGIWQGQSLFEAINSSIAPPARLSLCFSKLVEESGDSIAIDYDTSSYYSSYSYQTIERYGYNEADNKPTCTYTEIETKNNIPALYASVENLFDERAQKIQEKRLLENQLSTIQYSNDSTRNSYNTALFEKMSQAESSVYSTSTLGSVLRTNEETLQELRTKIRQIDQEVLAINSKIQGVIAPMKGKLHAVADEFNSQLKWLELKRFLLSLILLAPLAYFTIRKYFRVKNERSEYAIIWAAVALISTILSAQLFIIFVYRILPHRLIEAVAQFFAAIFEHFILLFVLLQWFGLILVPLFFGFLVYKIQKRYYNKEAIMIRALKDDKCPQCSMKIKDRMTFCPSCSYALRKPCTKCKHTSISYARFCEECGVAFVKN